MKNELEEITFESVRRMDHWDRDLFIKKRQLWLKRVRFQEREEETKRQKLKLKMHGDLTASYRTFLSKQEMTVGAYHVYIIQYFSLITGTLEETWGCWEPRKRNITEK